ncbi:MAG TPA: substrate-binding domain-containing protein [Acidimicrobiia bacterium]|nr:substrate-binding domain-containing protein [Acidimicrobiia bacterium]
MPVGGGRRRWWLVTAVALVLVTAIGAAQTPAAQTGAAPTGGAQTREERAASRATDRALRGRSTPVDPTPRPAVPGKHVVVISAGQASSTAKVGVDAAVAAAKAIGWQVDVYDAELNPANYAPLVRQAIAAGVDGIILGAIDCQAVAGPLREARAAKISVVAGGAFDCDDPHGGGAKRGLFSAPVNLEPLASDPAAFARGYGADQASYIVHASDNAAKILVLQDPEFTTLFYTDDGFRKQIARSHGSEIVSTLEITTADFTNGRLVPKIQAELLRHPEVTWIKSPFTFATTLGIIPALGANPDHIDVMGGEGLEPELDLLRDGKITAVNVFPSEWLGWAAVDTLNSVFRGEAPVASGVGWMLADADHNLPPSGPARSRIDYETQYRKAWGATG